MDGDKDIISIPFERIDGNIRLFYIYPTHYDKYPKYHENRYKDHNIVKFSASQRNLPIMFEVRLSRYDFNLAAKLEEAYDSFVGFYDHETLMEYKLDIYTIFRRSPNPAIPNTEAFFREHYYWPNK